MHCHPGIRGPARREGHRVPGEEDGTNQDLCPANQVTGERKNV